MSVSLSQDQKPTISSCSSKTLLTDSLKIFSRNKHLYFLIFTFVSFPLSFLHFHLSLSSFPLKSQILRLEYLATRAPTRFEARQVWKESREIVLSLTHLKLGFSAPAYLLSLVAAVSVVSATESRYNRRATGLHSVLAVFKSNWTRPLVTTICIYVILLSYSAVLYVFSVAIGNSFVKVRFLIWVFGSGVEICMMAVLGLGLVVSILEKKFGFDAFIVGWKLMEGRRITGWVLSGILAVATGGIGAMMESLVEKNAAKGWGWVALMGVYAAMVIWGFVVTTVFYCECRKRHVVRPEEEEEEMQLQGGEESQSLEFGS